MVGLVTDEVERYPDVTVPLADGTAAATRYEPVGVDGPLPAVVLCYPYRKDDYIGFGSQYSTIEYVTRSGYETVLVDLPGTGASSGRKAAPKEPAEERQLVSLVEWVADQEWCCGDVGMIGLSYGGWTSLRAAAAGPDPLKAIVPVASGHDPYRHHSYRRSCVE